MFCVSEGRKWVLCEDLEGFKVCTVNLGGPGEGGPGEGGPGVGGPGVGGGEVNFENVC